MFSNTTKYLLSMTLLCINFTAYATTMDEAYNQGVSSGNAQLQNVQQSSINQGQYHFSQPVDINNLPETQYTGDTLRKQAVQTITNGNTVEGQYGQFENQSVQSQAQTASENPDITMLNNPDLLSQIDTDIENATQTKTYCDDDGCTDTRYTPISQNEMNQALSTVSAGQEAAAEEPDDNLADKSDEYLMSHMQTFKGAVYKCRDMALNYDNCCSDSGWGQKIGLAGCNQQENDLWDKKGQDLCIYTGEYCSHKDAGICTEHKKSYCCFDSILAKIIQQQGRAQLGWTFGSGKHPSCGGFTPNELQAIDFSAIDFTEFYAQLESEMHTPTSGDYSSQMDMDAVQERVQEDMQRMFQP